MLEMVSFQLFEEGIYLFHHANTPLHKAKSIKWCFTESSVEELDCCTQSPDLNSTEQLKINGNNETKFRVQYLVGSLPRGVDILREKKLFLMPMV